MEIVVRAVRVYGTRDQYGPEPFADRPGSPIHLLDYPGDGLTTSVYVGGLPEFIREARKRKRALGRLALTVFACPPELRGMDAEERVNYFVADSSTDFEPRDCRSLLTLITEQSLTVGKDDLKDLPHYWLRPEVVTRLEEDMRSRAAPALDRVASIVGSIGASGLLSTRLVDDVYFFSEGKPPIADFDLDLSATAHVKRNFESFPLDDVQTALRNLTSAGEGSGQLDTARHLYVAGRREADPWKRFYWSFIVLEILSRKLGSKKYDSVLGELQVASHPSIGAGALASLVTPDNRTSLAGHFLIMALHLSPETAEADLEVFRRTKRVRDRMSHGDVIPAEELPVADLEALASRYMGLASR